jgi:D-alanine-D-alanine ligase
MSAPHFISLDTYQTAHTITPATLGRVAVLFGGTSAEREVSLKSGSMVLQALQAQGVDAVAFDPATHSLADLAALRPDRAMIALHGRYGEDGALQGALEMLKIPYTGSGVMASALAMDKLRTKQIWLHAGLPTPAYVTLTPNSTYANVAAQIGGSMVIKPVHEGSSIGISKVMHANEWEAALALAFSYDTSVYAEQYIAGAEITCPIVGDAVTGLCPLPVIQIVAPAGNYDYHHKYLSNETQYLCPSQLPPELDTQIQHITAKAFAVLGCSGWGRADFMLDTTTQQVWLLEMNTSPGMTDHSLVPLSAKAAGLSYGELVIQIAARATLHIKTKSSGQPT